MITEEDISKNRIVRLNRDVTWSHHVRLPKGGFGVSRDSPNEYLSGTLFRLQARGNDTNLFYAVPLSNKDRFIHLHISHAIHFNPLS